MSNNFNDITFSTKNVSEAMVPFLILHALKQGPANGALIKERVDALLSMLCFEGEEKLQLYNSRLYRLLPRFDGNGGLIKKVDKNSLQYVLTKEGERTYNTWKNSLIFFQHRLTELTGEKL